MAASAAATALGHLKAQGLDDQYEFEDPIETWIDLCEACRIPDMNKRKARVSFFLNVAKNSHWTHKLMEAEMLAQEDVDYTGGDTEPYSDAEEDDMGGPEPGSDYVPM